MSNAFNEQYGPWVLATGASAGIGREIARNLAEAVADPDIGLVVPNASVVSGLLNKIYAFENRFLPRMLPVKLFGFLMRRALKPGAGMRKENII